MNIEMKQTNDLKQQQHLTYRQRQSLQVLEASADSLLSLIETEVRENPLLEFTSAYYEQSYGSMSDDVMERVPSTQSLSEKLTYQWHTYHGYIHPICANFIVHSLDQNGYLRISIEEIADALHLQLDVVRQTLEIIQTFEPYGIAARDLSECLLIQCRYVQMQEYDLAEKIILHHLPDVAHKNYQAMQQACGCSKEELMAAIADIKSLQPKPAANECIGSMNAGADVLVQCNDDEIQIEIISSGALFVVHQDYDHLTAEVTAYLKPYRQRMKDLMQTIDRRNATLLAVMRVIAVKQRNFFLHQSQPIPLTLKEVAEMCDLHESTISRTIQSKLCEFHHTYIPLKFFFPSASASGESNLQVHVRLRDIIAKENTSKPYSDQALSDLLKKEGIDISRRTITKYREQCKIPSAAQRKQ